MLIMLHFHKTEIERYFLRLPPRGEGWFLLEVQLKFVFHLWTQFALYASYFINQLWRRCLQRACVLIAWNCKTAGCTLCQGHKPDGFPESPGNTTAFMKIISKYFLISMHVQRTLGQRRWQIWCNIPLLGAKMAEADALILLHLLCLNLALESWPCSLPHQSSPASPITTFAPGQLLLPYLRVCCPRTSTTSSSHTPHQGLSLPPLAHWDCITTPGWTQLTVQNLMGVTSQAPSMGRANLLRSPAVPHLQ